MCLTIDKRIGLRNKCLLMKLKIPFQEKKEKCSQFFSVHPPSACYVSRGFVHSLLKLRRLLHLDFSGAIHFTAVVSPYLCHHSLSTFSPPPLTYRSLDSLLHALTRSFPPFPLGTFLLLLLSSRSATHSVRRLALPQPSLCSGYLFH